MKNINHYINLYKLNNKYKRNLKPMFNIINSTINFNCKSFLDYGCGNGDLANYFNNIRNCNTYKYDPAILEYQYLDKNIKVDLIENCDVMEHIPEDEIDTVLEEISKISQNVFFNISLKKAKTILPNGENAHCTIKPVRWWANKINKYFKQANIIYTGYKNSVTFITWKIGFKEKVKIKINIFRNFINFMKYLIIYRIVKSVRK